MLPEYGKQDIQLDFYQSLAKHYSWVTQERAELIRQEAQQYNLSPYLIAAIIDRESEGKAKLLGPLRNVKLYRRGEIVKEPHRAVGLMQVMSFYADRKTLYQEENNIAMGTKIIHNCTQQNETLKEALRCYNSGQNSRVYNHPYINDVIASFHSLNGINNFDKENLYASATDSVNEQTGM